MFKGKLLLVAGFTVLMAGFGSAMYAQTPTGTEIMAKHYQIPKPKTESSTMVMTITKNKSKLTRSMTNWARGDNAKNEVENKMVKFTAPGDIKGSGFLTAKKLDGSTESQLWLPAMGKVRRLSSGASDQDSSFFGSDFTNRDISGFVQGDFTYTYVKTENGAFVVEAKPIKDAGYEKMVYSIDEQNYTTKKIEYYKAGKVAKFQEIVYATMGAYQVPALITMTSASGSKTELKISEQKVDVEVGDSVFTERFLKQ